MSAVTDEPESTSQISEPAVEGEEESPAYTSLDELINVGINIGDIKKAKDAGYVYQSRFFSPRGERLFHLSKLIQLFLSLLKMSAHTYYPES